MFDLWEFEYAGKVKIVDTDGRVFIGDAQEITDESERSDIEARELGITIASQGKLIEFFQSEIKSIEKL